MIDSNTRMDMIDILRDAVASDLQASLPWLLDVLMATTIAVIERTRENRFREIAAEPPGMWSLSIVRSAWSTPHIRSVSNRDLTARQQGIGTVLACPLDDRFMVYIGWTDTMPPDAASALRVVFNLILYRVGRLRPHALIGDLKRKGRKLQNLVEGTRIVPLDDLEFIVWRSTAMERIIDTVREIAAEDVTVLFTGETGVGKTGLARWLHMQSDRHDRPFHHLVVPAIPQELLGTSLFGSTQGAYTDAVHDRPGALAQAEGGTLFLDEIADIQPQTQAVLLNVIERCEYQVVGDVRTRKCNIRWLAATNHEDALRGDLRFRLGEEIIHIPPLRDRPEDVLPIFCLYAGLPVTAQAANYLEAQSWPGNHRQIAYLARALARRVRRDPVDVLDITMIQEEMERRRWTA